jgi:acyltransferase
MNSDNLNDRVGFIDMARFYAMGLVFYGHFIEEFMLLKNPVGAAQYKFIYSFHMVLFVLLAGYVAKDRDEFRGPGKFLSHRFYSRLLPFLFFTLLMMIPPIFFKGKFYGLVLPSVVGYTKGLIDTAFGLTLFCVPSWFLLLVVGLELVHFCFFRFLMDSDNKIIIAAVIFYIVGYYLNLKLDIFNPLKGRIVGWNYFFIHEAITLYSFYLTGLYLRRKRMMENISPKFLITGAALSFLIVLLTYELNHGPFNFHVYQTVVILFASHGNILLFPLTAMAGCALILCLAKLLPSQKTMAWLGQNTLILMCLNGIFYHYLNPGWAKWVLDHFSGSALIVTAAGVIITPVCLFLCIPFVYVLNRYIPQLVGKPKITGPILPRLVND